MKDNYKFFIILTLMALALLFILNYIFIVGNGRIQAHPDIKLLNRRVDSEPWYNTVKSSDGFSWLQIGGQDYFAAHKNITEEAGENITTIVSMIPKSLYDDKLGGIQVSAVIFLILALCFVGIMIMLVISLDKARRQESEAARAGQSLGSCAAADLGTKADSLKAEQLEAALGGAARIIAKAAGKL